MTKHKAKKRIILIIGVVFVLISFAGCLEKTDDGIESVTISTAPANTPTEKESPENQSTFVFTITPTPDVPITVDRTNNMLLITTNNANATENIKTTSLKLIRVQNNKIYVSYSGDISYLSNLTYEDIEPLLRVQAMGKGNGELIVSDDKGTVIYERVI